MNNKKEGKTMNNKKGVNMFSILWMAWRSIKMGGNLEMTLKVFGIDVRNGKFKNNWITWSRHLARPIELRVSKTKRIYASAGYDAEVSWMMSTKKNRIFNKGQVIGMTVFRAKGKKGGWCVNVHNQKVVLSETHKKFVFCNYWTHYWFSEQMFEAGLWAPMDKKSKAEQVLRTVHRDINEGMLMIRNLEQPKTSEETEKEWF